MTNPPTLLLLLEALSRKAFGSPSTNEERKRVAALYPRAKAWLEWIMASQAAKEQGTFRWRGRDPEEDKLMPTTFASGLDGEGRCRRGAFLDVRGMRRQGEVAPKGQGRILPRHRAIHHGMPPQHRRLPTPTPTLRAPPFNRCGMLLLFCLNRCPSPPPGARFCLCARLPPRVVPVGGRAARRPPLLGRSRRRRPGPHRAALSST